MTMTSKFDNIQRILISRTDSIGDVALTLPICVWIRQQFPNAELIYLGSAYTKPIITKFAAIDTFEDWSFIQNLEIQQQIDYLKQKNIDVIIHVFPNKKIAHIAKKAGIPIRIGTAHRSFHWFNCNHRVHFTRKRSDLHESQLNFNLLKPLGLKNIPSLKEIEHLIDNQFLPSKVKLQEYIELLFVKHMQTIILHPKSQGSALEWPIENYFDLALRLADKDYQVIFSGTEAEGLKFRNTIPEHKNILDFTGKLSLDEFMVVIKNARALVACSTGPLHIAGLYGTHAIGLFSPRKPIHPGRWRPLGKQVSIVVFDEHCPNCNAGKHCTCIADIAVSDVEALIS
jgi:ADP-heptose:LPS heptosyltransferase